MKSYPAKLESFQREIVQLEALQKLQNSTQTLIILWPVYAMLSILGDLKNYHFAISPFKYFYSCYKLSYSVDFYFNILGFQTNGKQPFSFPVLSHFCNVLLVVT